MKQKLLVKTFSLILILGILGTTVWYFWPDQQVDRSLRYVSTLAGIKGEIGEPFGVAWRHGELFISDGQNGKIWKFAGESLTVFAENLNTPSAIAFDENGNLIVADSGSHTILSVDPNGQAVRLAGQDGKPGFADGDAGAAQFNAPIGVTAAGNKIFIADTYNDRIRMIENGKVSTVAGSIKGFSDGTAASSRFDTPSGIAIFKDKLIVADTGNRRIRVVEPDGRTWTLAGGGESDIIDGSLLSASFAAPTAVAVDEFGSVFITDGNAIRSIRGAIPVVTALSGGARGFADGLRREAKFNRPSGMTVTETGELMIADSENRVVRQVSPERHGYEFTAAAIDGFRETPEQFRFAAPGRWPYDPPTAKRDIAGTLGEIRGEMTPAAADVWFHNGLDIAGSYGETARFVRDEKVLRPTAAENFGTLRELIRMPTIGYIHIRLGREKDSIPFGDQRFLFEKGTDGKLSGVRVPRGAAFKAGEPVGTLNAMNHVHLIAGRSGSEMNAFDALSLPGLSDMRPPVIEKVSLYDQNWNALETSGPNPRINVKEKTRIVVKAYDQVDGNSEQRRLGVYRLGYQLLNSNKAAVSDVDWRIQFDRVPTNAAVSFVYANGSHSGATGETIFNYIVTNRVKAEKYEEDFLDTASISPGTYVIRVFASDYFGNISSKDIEIEVIR